MIKKRGQGKEGGGGGRLGTGSTEVAACLVYVHPCCLLSSADSIAFFKAALIIDSQAFFYFKPTPFW